MPRLCPLVLPTLRHQSTLFACLLTLDRVFLPQGAGDPVPQARLT